VRRLWFLVPIAAGLAAGRWMPITIWEGLSDGLLILFGLLAAALVQIFPVTINFLPDTLTSDEIDRFGQALKVQQQYWMSLLCLTFFASFVALLVMGFKGHYPIMIPHVSFGVAELLSFLSGFSATAVFLRAFGIVGGVLSLQSLRTSILKKAALNREEEQRLKLQQKIAAIPTDLSFIPEGYGRIHKDDNPN